MDEIAIADLDSELHKKELMDNQEISIKEEKQ